MSFTPFCIVGCEDITASIHKHCKLQGIDSSITRCIVQDFTLFVRIDTPEEIISWLHSKHLQANSQSMTKTANEFMPLSREEALQLDISAQYNQQHFSIKQVCDVLVVPKEFECPFFLEVSEYKDKVLLHFDDSFIAFDETEFFEDFYTEIITLMALEGIILCNLKTLRLRLQEILTQIKSDPKAKQHSFCIKQSELFIPPKPARFVFLPQERYQTLLTSHHLESKQDSKLDSAYYASVIEQFESAFFGVAVDEVVGVYEFGDVGRAGRNLAGVYMSVPNPSGRVIPTDQQHIYYQVFADKIQYHSKIQGFIALNTKHTARYATPPDRVYSLDSSQKDIAESNKNLALQPDFHKLLDSNKDNANISSISSANSCNDMFVFFQPPATSYNAATTPPLLGGIEAGIELRIISDDSSVDAVGDNLHIEAKTLYVLGMLGSNTTLKASYLSLDGASHHNSNIFATNAKILTHRGFLLCEKCIINTAESAKIYADNARIVCTNGSHITAQTMQIKTLRSNNVCYFSKSLNIEEIPHKKGRDNTLICTIQANKAYREYITNVFAYIHKKQQTITKSAAMLVYYTKRAREAQIFLQKLQGFTKPQLEMALNNQDYAQKYRQAFLHTKLYKTFKARQESLLQSIQTLNDITLPKLQNMLKTATIHIGFVGGFDDNYASLACDFPPYKNNIPLKEGMNIRIVVDSGENLHSSASGDMADLERDIVVPQLKLKVM